VSLVPVVEGGADAVTVAVVVSVLDSVVPGWDSVVCVDDGTDVGRDPGNESGRALERRAPPFPPPQPESTNATSSTAATRGSRR
jgi:hypothetical protein